MRFTANTRVAILAVALAWTSSLRAQDDIPLATSDVQLPASAPENAAESVDWLGGKKSACEPWFVSREPLFHPRHVDDFDDWVQDRKKNTWLPVSVGAWHLFHQDLYGQKNAYGLPGIPGTNFWYINADPVVKLESGRKVGGHMELRFREQRQFRSFIKQQIWPWEAYGYIQDDELGTLKAGLLYRRFGLFWDGSFFGSAPYFNGNKLNADYGVSWEKTTDVDDCFSVDSFAQFFFHEDASNGSFSGADPESLPGYTQRNTGVARLVPTWKGTDGSVTAVGFSAMVGQAQSRLVGIPSSTLSAYGADLNYTRGPWRAYLEGQQSFGVLNPMRFVSGGPSTQITSVLTGLHYTHGAVTYRTSYSALFDAHPAGTLNVLVTGVTVMVSKNVDLYCEYVNVQLEGNSNPASNGPVFNSFDVAINWHF